MPLNDFLGIGKVLPIDKLIDVVSISVGRLSKTYFDKKDVETKAFEIKKLAEARAEEMKIIANSVKENFQITGGIDYKAEKIYISSPKEIIAKPEDLEISIPEELELSERTTNRMDFQQNKRQLNIETVTAFAADELINEPPIDNNPIDEDWTTRFFNIVEDISNEEMQILWGKILAGEITHPKSYSLRTLEILKNISKEEAEVFMKFAQAKVISNDKHFIYNQDNGKFLEEKFGITFSERLLMTELGLIASENNLEFSLVPTLQDKHTIIFYYGSKGIVFYRGENVPKQPIKVLLLTKTGIELSKLISQKTDNEYIRKICLSFDHENVKIEYGDLIKLPNGQLILKDKIEFKK